MADQPFRVLPRLEPDTEFFWKSGEDGKLRFLRCNADGTFLHPPAPVCPKCLGRDLSPAVVSGRGVVATFTINHQPWYPGLDPPYVIAIVEIDEDPSVRFTCNIVNCAPEDVSVGMPVQVVFEQYDDVWLPFFEPVAGGASS
ncbi:MAG: Zn-ribbon domain-containing OB-fold protein [Actinobacteria bacterium]|nr:Zn-ribbon domain-containing OB-fold protein [Actinomycetota bacterium]